MSSADPPYLKALKGEYGVMKYGWFKSYKAKYIDAGKFAPVVHIITFIMCLGYSMEFGFHLKHERHAAKAKHSEHH